MGHDNAKNTNRRNRPPAGTPDQPPARDDAAAAAPPGASWGAFGPGGMPRSKADPMGLGSVVDRRAGLNRRNLKGAKDESDLDRRRGAGRRLSDFTRSAEEGEMTKEQFLFLMAIDEFKKANRKSYPTWTDVLEVIRLLGYRKTMATEITLNRAEDWREPADAASNVRADHWAERGGKPGKRAA